MSKWGGVTIEARVSSFSWSFMALESKDMVTDDDGKCADAGLTLFVTEVAKLWFNTEWRVR